MADPSPLAAAQAAFLDTLYHGPGRCPDGLFAGPRHRVWLGLAAHANTVSHARLVALEDSFPRLLALAGAEHFNRLCRAFVGLHDARAMPLARIGETFPTFLAAAGADPHWIDCAEVDRAWLRAFHAADRAPLALDVLATPDPDALAALPVALHPASALVMLGQPADAGFAAATGLPEGCEAVLVTRPDATVDLHVADPAQCRLLAAARTPGPLGNLLALLPEQRGGIDVGPLLALVEAGALALAEGRDTSC